MKYVIAIILTALIVGLGVTAYFKGWFPTISFNKPQAVSTEATVVPTPEATILTTVPTSSPSADFTRVQSGGILVFNKYTIDVPNDWTYTKEPVPTGGIEIDKLVLAKGLYKITIYEAATGGASCLYPGDPDSQGPSSRFTSFAELTTASNDILRRGSVEGSASGFTVCEKQVGGFGEPTAFGHISIATPANPSSSMLGEVDSILSSLRKI